MAYLIGHLLGDWLLQNDWMASGKKEFWLPLAVHALLYAAGVGLITGWPLGAADDELKQRGVDFVLSKPFTMEALQTALAKLRT